MPAYRSPVHPVQVALYERLTDDPSLSALVTGVFDQVPEGQPHPYVRIGDQLSIGDNDHSGYGRQITSTIHVWTRSRGNAEGQAIAARIAELLNEQERELDVDGHRVVSCRLEYDQALPDPDPQIRHHVVRFRITTTQIEE
ncbi:MAG TPA: DUF3168 domain-containing protein [Candidatus Limnocylindrales bacterium]